MQAYIAAIGRLQFYCFFCFRALFCFDTIGYWLVVYLFTITLNCTDWLLQLHITKVTTNLRTPDRDTI